MLVTDDKNILKCFRDNKIMPMIFNTKSTI